MHFSELFSNLALKIEVRCSLAGAEVHRATVRRLVYIYGIVESGKEGREKGS